MITRAKVPLRLGLAGGGTDTSPYADLYGGTVLNATISTYAYTTIIPKNNGKITLSSIDLNEKETIPATKTLQVNSKLALAKGVYNRVVKEFTKKPMSFELTTFVDAPSGSGLGGSSTVVVSILGAFAELLNIPLGEYDLAQLAYDIERNDLKILGGRQDQYAATFGGVNFMEFSKDNKVIVNPLKIKTEFLSELEHNLLLYFTGTTRSASALSSKIIENQSRGIKNRQPIPLQAMHKLKEQAIMMKEALLTGKIDQIGEILNFGWRYKKNLAEGVSNPEIDKIYNTALASGATGGKISGAGGGGFMMIYCPKNSKYKVKQALDRFGGEFMRFQFTQSGLQTWTV